MFSGVSLHIGIPKFKLEFRAPLMEQMPAFELGEITIRAAVDADVEAVLTLLGSFDKTSALFQTERFSFLVEASVRRPRAVFVSSSIMSIVGLAGQMELKIPEAGLSQTVPAELRLPVICARLEERQMAYRAMVIERATGRTLLLPPKPTGRDLGAIAFSYHAIVDRTFTWPNTHVFEGSVPANEKGRTEFSRPTRLKFSPIPLTRKVLGETIQLGSAGVIIEDAVAVDPEEAFRELAADDGHQVPMKLRSLTGRANYEFLTSPKLSPKQWDPFLQSLIEIEPQLDAEIIERYHHLAAETLSDLTPEETAMALSQPELDEDSFDWEMEIES
jgi:hypothetical protein